MPDQTMKQRRFVDESLIDLNATQAAIRAGYRRRSANKIGPEQLGETGVQEAIRECKAVHKGRVQVDQLDVLAASAGIRGDVEGDSVRPRTSQPGHASTAWSHSFTPTHGRI